MPNGKKTSFPAYYIYIMDELIRYLLRFGNLNAPQIELVSGKAVPRSLKKGDYFSQAGKTPQEVGFLTNGIMRVCYYGNKGDEFTRCFLPHNRFAVDANSFYNHAPSSEYVEALTDCEMLVFSRADFMELTQIIPNWSDIFARIISNSMMMKLHDSSTLLVLDAASRYRKFMEMYPGLVNRVPLSAVASYLGMTQSSLSRIRKNID